MTENSKFTQEERQVLHSLAEMFSEKDCRDELRILVQDGATIRQLILAYKTNKRVVSTLKTVGGLIVLGGATVAALKGLNLWPK